MTSPDWWICISNMRCERRATIGLIDRGYEVWQPCQWVETRLGKGRWHACKKLHPAPGYLFVRPYFPGMSWHAITEIDGIRAIRCIDERPQHVPDAQIIDWRLRLAPGYVGTIEDAYRFGDHVRVTSGPFDGIQAIVEQFVAGKGVWVTADMLGRKARMLVATDQLQKVG